ncbi:hypothetical protein BGZ82_003143 [Podila clonocystis]|nr:hypothetical protein BGZ82_003143 [Podila clonocystis]
MRSISASLLSSARRYSSPSSLEECDDHLIPFTYNTSLTDFKTSRTRSEYGLHTEDAEIPETLTRSKRMKFIDVYRCYNFRPQAVAPRLPPLRVILSSKMEVPADTGFSFNTVAGLDSQLNVQAGSHASVPTLVSLPPEILHTILSNFGEWELSTLSICARVNRSLSNAVVPLLWRKIYPRNGKTLEHLLSTEGCQGLVKNAAHIRELLLVGEDMLKLFIPQQHGSATDAGDGSSELERATDGNDPLVRCTNLVSLVVASFKDSFLRMDDFCVESFQFRESSLLSKDLEQGIMAFIQSNPRIKSVRVLNVISPMMAQTIIHGGLPNLQELDFRSRISAQTTKTLLDTLPQYITKFTLAGIDGFTSIFSIKDSDDDDEDEDKDDLSNKDKKETFNDKDDVTAEAEPISHHALTKLHLYGNLEDHVEYILLPFLNTCSTSLTDFKTTGIDCYKNNSVRDALARLDVHMESIYFRHDSGYDEDAEDEEIAETLALSKRMKFIDLYRCYNTGPQAVAAILGSAEHLENLALPSRCQVSSADLQAILSQAMKLRHFIKYYPDFWIEDLSQLLSLSASEFLGFEWKSPSLQAFGCVIQVPRPNDHMPQEHQDPTWNNPTLEHSHQVQRQVYRQLGKQTHLQQLYLGASIGSPEVPHRLWYSLEMTLSSGLDELAGMKNLCVLSVHHMNQHIGVKELEWMCDHWPSLLRIDGMCLRGEKLPAEIKEWLEEERRKGHLHEDDELNEEALRRGYIIWDW